MKKIIDKLLNRDNPQKQPDQPEYEIWEGACGYFHYHLSTGGRKGILCGEVHVMPTNLPLNTWGFKSAHINETYCKECERLANEEIKRISKNIKENTDG